MSGGIQGIDTNGIEKILAKSSKKQLITGIIIGIVITGSFFILQNIFFDDPIVIERTIETQKNQYTETENPPTSVEILKTDDGYTLNVVDYLSFSNSNVETQKVAEKIIRQP